MLYLILILCYSICICISQHHEDYEYNVVFSSPGSLGIVFEPCGSGGVEVRSLVSDGTAFKTGLIEIGDRLIMLNGDDVSNAREGDVMKAIPQASFPRVLRFRPRKAWDRKAVAVENNEIIPDKIFSPPISDIVESSKGILRVVSPPIVAGDYNVVYATFGAIDHSSDAVNASITLPLLGCNKVENGDNIQNTYTLIERGKCTYYHKVRNAFTAGAKGVIIINTDKSGSFIMPAGHYPTEDINIPVVMIDKADGKLLYQVAASQHDSFNLELVLLSPLHKLQTVAAARYSHYSLY